MTGVKGFVLKVTLWLPAAFAAWYYLSILHVAPISWMTGLLLGGLFPDLISGVHQTGHMIEITTNLDLALLQPAAGVRGGVIAFDLNPLIYGYGLPLLTGLILASPGDIEAKVFRIVAGGLVLLPFQAWGVSCDALKTLYFNLGPQVAQAARSSAGVPPDVVALAYQLGYLILPAVTPVLCWIAMHRDFIGRLAPRLGQIDEPDDRAS